MKIKSFEVHGLFGQDNLPPLTFNDDLNILSGRNGAGKTTVLKLMWYLISGNFDKAVAEIKFNSAKLETDKYKLSVEINYDQKDQPFESSLYLKDITCLNNFENDDKLNNLIDSFNSKEISWFLTQYIDSSFFMPTFRMIEGGFTTEKYDIKHDVLKEFYLKINKDDDFNNIEKSLNKLSNNLTRQEHKFITNISANDIDTFLLKKYIEIMNKVNEIQSQKINFYTDQYASEINTSKKESVVNNLIKELDKEHQRLIKPLNQIKELVTDFMPYYEMEFESKLYFLPQSRKFEKKLNHETRDLQYFISYMEEKKANLHANGLTIKNLSAGEKQLLTFIAYNTFYDNTIFFIDEPELSLHVDWQSKLFSLLKEQNPTNQFIISTHSPFIYSIFPDKEITLNVDKGCSEY
ncbi:AAA family ATPase [Acinetobacter brisouii]|uniref:AAA family ATPase n=1 Tax=Acinetobacter brisouii TaxID=396323 RepID=UPI00124C18D4|nr:AAA family ATPase [Acinetobacter brisouii]